jgi:hypothetical protein
MKLTLLPLAEDNLIRIRFEGDLTSPHLRAGGDPLVALLGPHCYGHKVLCSMEGARSIDSGGVCWLLSVDKRFRQARGRFILFGVPGIVMDVLVLLRLTPLFSMAANEAEACGMAARSEPAVIERIPRAVDHRG